MCTIRILVCFVWCDLLTLVIFVKLFASHKRRRTLYSRLYEELRLWCRNLHDYFHTTVFSSRFVPCIRHDTVSYRFKQAMGKEDRDCWKIYRCKSSFHLILYCNFNALSIQRRTWNIYINLKEMYHEYFHMTHHRNNVKNMVIFIICQSRHYQRLIKTTHPFRSMHIQVFEIVQRRHGCGIYKKWHMIHITASKSKMKLQWTDTWGPFY